MPPAGPSNADRCQSYENVTRGTRRLALAAHNALGGRGRQPRGLFATTIGGREAGPALGQDPTRHDRDLAVPELAADGGITFDELVQRMVEDASTNR